MICGAPATGKTTLSRRLATDLTMPLLLKDAIKESLAAEPGVLDRAASRRIGATSYRMLYDGAHAMLERGENVMIEANLHRRWAEQELARLAALADITLVQCVAERAMIERRYRDRHARGERHAVHLDLEALPDLLAALDDGGYDLSTFGYRLVSVTTDDGYRPAYRSFLARLRWDQGRDTMSRP